MPLENFTVKSKLTDYPVFFGEAEEYLPRLAAGPDCVFAVDENVWRLHKDSTLKPLESVPKIILPISEDVKTLESVHLLYDRIVEFAPKKNIRLVSIGGGITQDITGFVASTLYRGVKWTFIPTTLLAQADS
ncbi:MAG: 3-dehydroquinate synthase, partial [bacterium]